MKELIVIGGGLAGTEAAWQAAELGVPVRLYEMRPDTPTPAHDTPWLAEWREGRTFPLLYSRPRVLAAAAGTWWLEPG